MLALVAYKDTRQTREFLAKIAKNLEVSCQILIGTNEIKENEETQAYISFGKAARNRISSKSIPVLELEAISKMIKMQDEQKLEIWNKIQTFIGTYISLSGKKFLLLTDMIEATFGNKADISWPELEMIISMCELLGIQKGNLELIKEEK